MQALDVLPMIMSGWGTLVAVRGVGGVGEKGGLRRLLAGQSGINPAAELLVESPALWVTELVRIRNSIIVCGRSRPALPTSPTMGPRKSPKQDRYCSPARFTSSSTCASFSSIFCHRAFTSILISWPS